MAKGMSLHIGLNAVNPTHYGGWSGPLTACEFDANDMQAIASIQGFKSTKLLTKQATRAAVANAVKLASQKLVSGDMFFITYSGHGGQVPDTSNDEPDALDETWCLFDGEMIDDELDALWALFKKDVRIFVLSDSCHSGTVTRGLQPNYADGKVYRLMPPDLASSVYLKHKTFYDKIQAEATKGKAKPVVANVKLISGCMDRQFSGDGAFNGVFTGALKQVWNGGKFKGNYASFHKQIISLMPASQTPNLFNTGVANAAYDAQKPFTI